MLSQADWWAGTRRRPFGPPCSTGHLLSALPGDFNIDGRVNGTDLLLWQRGLSPNPLSQSDLNDWRTNYGAVATVNGATTALPEPSVWILLVMGAIGMFSGRLMRQFGADPLMNYLFGET